MYPLKRLLVGLDLTEMDVPLIKYAAAIAKASSSHKIYFINVVPSLNIPPAVQKEFPLLMDNALEERKNQIWEKIEAHFEIGAAKEIQVTVKEGVPAKKILKFSLEKNIDLIIVGRKTTLKGSGLVSYRLARRAACSLFIIPEGMSPRIEKILVPSDFSDYSVIAMEEAFNIAKKTGAKVIVQNVYNVPAGYHYTGRTFEEFARIMEKNAKKDYRKFIKKIETEGIKPKVIYSLDRNDDPVEDIYEMAEKLQPDTIIIGAKGRTATTAIFLGSLAERLVQINKKYPMMVVRPKGKNAGILDYFLEL
ncbi:MAG: universal stress protein [Bacteroidota bacterium]|nr:universal stress protein [Bacteroidota bacterium]